MTPWWKQAKIYELYIDRFADTVQGLIGRLDYLKKLGINTLHILPHYPSPMIDDGYDISDYRNVRPTLGTLDDFKTFLNIAHEKNIRVILDFVLNHTSDQHPWFVEARSSKINPKREYYLWSDTPDRFNLVQSGIGDIKDSNWTFNQATGDYYFSKYYPQQPDLNWDNDAVFEEMTDIMLYWAAMGADGFRLDAAPHLIKREGSMCEGLPETHAVLKRIRKKLEASYPEVILLAEAHQSIADTKRYFGNGDECHMAYHFTLMEQMWIALQRGNLISVQQIIEQSSDIPENCQWAIFLRNHDEISMQTLDADTRKDLLVFLDPSLKWLFRQGEATSMRIGQIFNGNRKKLLAAFEMLYSLPGSPIMYYGDEIGMFNLPHEESIRDSRKYVRGKFDWEVAELQRTDSTSLFHEVAALIKKVPTV
jgi:maltose alpha-D-glucosyltransferase/alpha-amylase